MVLYTVRTLTTSEHSLLGLKRTEIGKKRDLGSVEFMGVCRFGDTNVGG